jgi:hypothetical protein
MAKNATLSPLDEIQALQARLKELKSTSQEEIAADATAKFRPLHDQFVSAFAAVGDADDDAERAAHAVKWIGENVTEYRRLSRLYLKTVHNTPIPRTPRAVEGDSEG